MAKKVGRLVGRIRKGWRRSHFRHRIEVAKVAGRAAGGGPRPIRILVVSDGEIATSEQQFAPMLRHGAALARRFGTVFRFEGLDFARRLTAEQARGYAAIILKMSFRTEAGVAVALARHIALCCEGTPCRFIYFDGDDDVAIQWPDVLSLADGYVKKHLFANREAYGTGFIGKSNLTDYVARQYGVSFADNIIPESRSLAPEQTSKLILGWNIALDDKIHDLGRSLPAPDASGRDIDLLCRASVPTTKWTHPMRAAAVTAIEALGDRYRVLAPLDRVQQDEYYAELLRSRFCISPFGYGELCWRDFESILCGAVLVKPDMSHLRTAPDLFLPGETYVPVRWDYSDLETACVPFLSDESRRQEIAQKARKTLIEALGESLFVERFGHVLRRAGLLGTGDVGQKMSAV